jgi:signal transduction histidine kinase
MRSTDAEKFKAIANATNQMSRLTEDLLFLARAEQIPISEWVSVNLTEILNNLFVLYKPQAEAKRIDLTANLTTDLYLVADPVQLTRLFSNLIENALQYTPVAGKVEIQTSRVSGYIFISVTDTGIGIAPEHLEIIFDRFWQANQSRSYWTGASGLGLAIALAIAQKHGGLITVTSQVEVGSCFTVQLPIGTSLSTE